MLRIVIITSAFVFFANEGFKPVSVEQDIAYISSENSLDPVITGHSVSRAHKSAWQKRAEAYNRCGLCGEEMQSYPGD
jgi:hypothetical protein